MKIPLVDLKAQYKNIKPKIRSALNKVLESGSFVLGEEVELFEKEFASYCGTKYCLGVNSGTSALHLALLSAGIKLGDEIITQPNTFFATGEAISYLGAKPVFVDIDPKTYNIDILKIEAVLTKKTRAILPVHLFGFAADLDGINKIAEKNNLIVIEDACQSHGVRYKGKRVGALGESGCFSFYPGKVLGAFGEGGALITDNKEIYEKARALRDHGQIRKYHHSCIGYNYRMDSLQGAVLRVKLKYLDDWIEKRRNNALIYNKLLKGVKEVVLPFDPDYSYSNYYVYVVRCQERDELKNFLNKRGIGAQIHYPVPLHLQEGYKFLGYEHSELPIAEKYAKEILSLPMFPELSIKQIHYIVNSIKKFYNE